MDSKSHTDTLVADERRWCSYLSGVCYGLLEDHDTKILIASLWTYALKSMMKWCKPTETRLMEKSLSVMHHNQPQVDYGHTTTKSLAQTNN